MKKITKGLCTFALLSLISAPTFAGTVEFNWGNGQTATVNIPDDLMSIVNDNKSAIENALTTNNVSQTEFQTNVNDFYNDYSTYLQNFSTQTPYTDTVNGLDDFCGALRDTIPNTQTIQNVWAKSWIGMLRDMVGGESDWNFGFGVNAGVATLDITALKKVGNSLNVDMSNLKSDKLVFPTITADIRLGGIVLPFDFGFVFSTLDTRWFDSIDKEIAPSQFDYFSIGSDLRYKILNNEAGPFNLTASASGGFYYTSGGVNVEKDDSGASLDFSSTTFFGGAQISAKALCFVPFVGGRIMLAKSSVDWKAKANWNSILNSADQNISQVLSYGVLPSEFEGGTSNWSFRPQIYGGLGLDLFVIDITVSASYDIVKSILGGAVSLRFSL